MNNLKAFDYDGQAVRTVEHDGSTWWVLRDVCDVLGLSDTNKVGERLDIDELTRIKLVSGGQNREMYIINESGLYNVIIRSDKPEAKRFKRWVTHEVLPSIRKHGAYMTQDKIDDMINNPDNWIKLLSSLREEQTQRAMLQKEVKDNEPKVIFADAVSTSKSDILIGELAKILKGNGVEIGQNRLFAWLRKNGYLIKRNGGDCNTPTQKAMELGLFRIKETVISHSGGYTEVKKTTKVTGKGQQYFINKLLKLHKEGLLYDNK